MRGVTSSYSEEQHLQSGATHVALWKNSRKIAFTLAEVLITLGIIGVVVLLTAPWVLQYYQKKLAVEHLKATYSIIFQAFESAKYDYGDIVNWGLDDAYGQSQINAKEFTANFVEKYFIPYVKVTSNYGNTSLKNVNYKSIYNLDNSLDKSGFTNGVKYIILLSNGSLVAFSLNGACINNGGRYDENGVYHCDTQYVYSNMTILVDINSFTLPNTYGKDIFLLQIKNNKLEFYAYNNSRSSLLRACSKGSNENRCCGALILLDGWQIKYKW